LQLPKAEVVLAVSLVLYGDGFSLQLHNINSSFQSVYVHAVLGGDRPRWQPLNGADCHALLAGRQLERVLTGGNGDTGIQLRPDSGGATSSARKQLAAATAERHQFSMAMDSNLFNHFRIIIVLTFGLFLFSNFRINRLIYGRPF
jgi:hypothetical protein